MNSKIFNPANSNQALRILLTARFFSAFGYFGLVCVLSLILAKPPFHFSPYQIGLLLAIFALADSGLSFFWAPLIPRLGNRKAMLLGLSISFISLLLIPLIHHHGYVLILFFAFGLGSSANSLATRLWLYSYGEGPERAFGFSLFYRTFNAAAGIAASIVFLLPYQELGSYIFSGTAFLFLLNYFLVYFFFAEERKRAESRDSIFIKLARDLTKEKALIQYSIIVLSILFLSIYFTFQKNILPYFLERFSVLPPSMGLILAINPIMVTVLQRIVTRSFLFLHARKSGLGILTGLVLFGISFGFISMGSTTYSLVT